MSQVTTTTPDIKSFFAKAKPAAKAQVKADLAKGTTKAKTATTPAGKQKLVAKIKEANRTKTRLSSPGELARCRAVAGGDLRAAFLLYKIAGHWRTIHPKMRLKGSNKEYLAMTQADWAIAAGLDESEVRKYAIPRLKKYAGGIVEIEVHGRGSDKKTWIHLNEEAYQAAKNEGAYELKIKAEAGAPLYP